MVYPMIIKVILFAGCFFVAILCLGQLFVRQKKLSNYALIAFLVICSVCLFSGSFRLLGIAHHFPHLNKTYLPFFCATGPLAYFYIRCILEGAKPDRSAWPHLIPTVCCIILSIPFYLQSAEFKNTYMERDLYDVATISIYIATRIAEASLLIYMGLALVLLSKLYKNSPANGIDKGEIKTMILICSLTLFGAICRPIGAVNGFWLMSIFIPVTMICLALITLYCASHRYPRLLGLNPDKVKPSRKKSGNMSKLELVKEQIIDQQFFLESDITLNKLATELQISPRELSELINDTADQNFTSFLNTFRIEHAKKLLTENPELSVLQVVYASGFNSKSAFYKQFTNATGLTPFAYRKEKLAIVKRDTLDQGLEKTATFQ